MAAAGAHRAAVRLRVRRRVLQRERVSARQSGAARGDRRLWADRPQARRGAGPPRTAGRRHDSALGRGRELVASYGGRVCATVDELLALEPDVVDRRHHPRSAGAAGRAGAAARARTCWSRSRPGWATAQVERPDRAPQRGAGRRVKVGFNHRFHPALSELAAEVHSGEPRRADACARPLRPRRAARAMTGSGGPSRERSGGRRADRPGHAPARSHPLARRAPAAALARCCARSSGTRRSRTTRRWSSATPTTAQRPWAMLHVTWTEWKNMFSLEVYCRTAKLQVDGLVRSYGPQRLRIYRMAPELGRRSSRSALRRRGSLVVGRVGALRRRARDGRPLLGDLARRPLCLGARAGRLRLDRRRTRPCGAARSSSA